MPVATLQGKILYSGQLATTSPTAVYTVPLLTEAEIDQAVVCNTSGTAATISVSILKKGDTVDGTHEVIHLLSVPAGDTQSLKDYLGSTRLGPQESIWVTAGTGAVLNVVITGGSSS